ncbi:hypothetical protein CY34DRAFT_797860 [Suillus luteus UH-Slu-Lm8-n1]|uniref:Uncharacterized protein n=1 Tax=Suillus luteus UH-Slu-Lm8-n1 TaxID=930992 RepID=A0A0D0C1C9_9AGAM|nr:hypothetical protein CY34DRAFT_797860 [Suillus luteus UH-Slu-Lm8-n1]
MQGEYLVKRVTVADYGMLFNININVPSSSILVFPFPFSNSFAPSYYRWANGLAHQVYFLNMSIEWLNIDPHSHSLWTSFPPANCDQIDFDQLYHTLNCCLAV